MLTGGRLYFGLTTADRHTKCEFAWPNIYMQHNGVYNCQKVFVLWRSMIKMKAMKSVHLACIFNANLHEICTFKILYSYNTLAVRDGEYKKS